MRENPLPVAISTLALPVAQAVCAHQGERPAPSRYQLEPPALVAALGHHSHVISRRNPLAQRYLDQGLV